MKRKLRKLIKKQKGLAADTQWLIDEVKSINENAMILDRLSHEVAIRNSFVKDLEEIFAASERSGVGENEGVKEDFWCGNEVDYGDKCDEQCDRCNG